ncbi:MAG: squalene/phytoene synthase family protein [Longimicrobiales bacterium]
MELSQLLRATSRTFALGIELLASPLKEQVRIAYLVLRVSDYLEDNRVMSPDRKVELLNLWHRILHGEAQWEDLAQEVGKGGDPIPDLEAVRHVEDIITAYKALDPAAAAVIAHHAGDSTLGMARWIRRGPVFEDESDLDDYMHEVAGRVGYLLTDLFAARSQRVSSQKDELMEAGRGFGLALQTVNVIRGLSSDRDRGWIFVPRSFLPAGMDPSALFRTGNEEGALLVLDTMVAKAERHFRDAQRYVTALPRSQVRIRLFCLLPLFFGLRTLAISRRNPAVLTGEVKITRKDVRSIARNSSAFGMSNLWIRWYSDRLLGRSKPMQQA